MTMTRNFCTYFDKNYLLRGLALYRSLEKHCPDFTLWILCFDDESFALLEKMRLGRARLIRLSDFEDDRLRAAKAGRKLYEYYWTCTPSLPAYILAKDPSIDSIAYIDADMLFYASPEPIFAEMGSDSILIIPHNYSPQHAHRAATSGIYNVGLLIFKNDERGRACLSWWRERCIEWCFDRAEGGKFGDQKYLDDWTTRFPGVHVLAHQGANVASWNIDSWDRAHWPLLFFHFHGLKMYLSGGRIRFYPIQILDRKIFGAYRNALQSAYADILAVDPSWRSGLAPKLDLLRFIKQSAMRALQDLKK
jgi:hypothetical protein